MEYENTLDRLIAEINPKGWTKFVKKRPDFLEWLNNQTPYKTLNISELVFLVKNAKESPICEFGKKRIFKNFYEGYRVGCGKHCECVKASQKNKLKKWHQNLTQEQKQALVDNARQTFLENYGVENSLLDPQVQQKIKQTNFQRYGAETPFESEVIRNKIKNTIKQRYGVYSPLQNPDIQRKARDNYVKRHGKLMSVARAAKEEKYGSNPWPPHILEKANKSKIEKYGHVSVFALQAYRDQINQKQHARLKEKYGEKVYNILFNKEAFENFVKGKTALAVVQELGISGTGDRILGLARQYGCLDQMIFKPQSNMEENLVEFFDSLNIKYKRNDKKLIVPNQLDFIIEDAKIAIELHGLFHHSELSSNRGSTYHYKKYQASKDVGYQLLQFYQDEFWRKNAIVKSMILAKLNLLDQKIDARKTTIVEINNNQANTFYVANHINGACFGSSLNIALVDYDQNIVAALSLQRIKNTYQLLRFAVKLNMLVRGAFGKLFKYFVNSYTPKLVETYSDNRFSNGRLYQQHGFEKTMESGPSYFVTDYNQRFYSRQFTRPKIQKKFGIDIEGKTTWECIQEVGYDRIWDAGKIKWRYVS
jgi:very-short-patch-repair endonuclease